MVAFKVSSVNEMSIHPRKALILLQGKIQNYYSKKIIQLFQLKLDYRYQKIFKKVNIRIFKINI